MMLIFAEKKDKCLHYVLTNRNGDISVNISDYYLTITIPMSNYVPRVYTILVTSTLIKAGENKMISNIS